MKEDRTSHHRLEMMTEKDRRVDYGRINKSKRATNYKSEIEEAGNSDPGIFTIYEYIPVRAL